MSGICDDCGRVVSGTVLVADPWVLAALDACPTCGRLKPAAELAMDATRRTIGQAIRPILERLAVDLRTILDRSDGRSIGT